MTDVRDGDLCSVAESDRFRVAKVLRVEPDAVHIRLYAQTFLNRPVAVNADELTLGTMHDAAFGIGHLPLAREEFERWEPAVIAHGTVTPEELEAYDLWLDAAAAKGARLWGAPKPTLVDRIRALLRQPKR